MLYTILGCAGAGSVRQTVRYYQLDMGEGIAGPATVGAGTTTLHSCTGIAFGDRPKEFGGLYHYSANNLGINVTATIRQMVQDIQSIEINLTPTDPGIYPTKGSRKDDIVAVIEFLGTVSSVAAQRLEPDSVAKPVWNDGVPTLNGPPLHEYEKLERRSVEQTIRSTMRSGRRIPEGDVWYYGGDGETEGVLKQGLPAPNPPRQTSRKRCIVM